MDDLVTKVVILGKADDNERRPVEATVSRGHGGLWHPAKAHQPQHEHDLSRREKRGTEPFGGERQPHMGV